MADVEVESFVAEEFSRFDCFLFSLFRQVDVMPAGEEVEPVPFAFAVSHQNESHAFLLFNRKIRGLSLQSYTNHMLPLRRNHSKAFQ